MDMESELIAYSVDSSSAKRTAKTEVAFASILIMTKSLAQTCKQKTYVKTRVLENVMKYAKIHSVKTKQYAMVFDMGNSAIWKIDITQF